MATGTEARPAMRRALVFATLLSAARLPVLAHQPEPARKRGPPRKEQKPWGIAGDARAVNRTIDILMSDAMRFKPDTIEVKQGEVVRFMVRNAGKVMHEMVIGTRKELDLYAAMMAKFPGMEHDEPYVAHVASGRLGELIWEFNRPGEFAFACLIDGHYQAGMVGKILVSAQRT